MNQALEQAVDAFSASPAIRLRFQMLKAREAIPMPILPLPVGMPCQLKHGIRLQRPRPTTTLWRTW
jgi:hypothetical protein